MHVLPRAREVARALPLADVLEHGAPAHGRLVHGRRAHGIEQRTAREAREAAETDRRVRHAKRRVADVRHRLADLAGDDAEHVEARGLALVGRHARCGVALHVLDRTEAFPAREREVARRHVVLEIHECFRPAARLPRSGDAPRLGRPVAAAHLEPHRRCRVSARARRGESRGCTVREHGREPEHAAARACRVRALGRLRRNKGPRRVAPGKPAARLREEVHRGRVARRHQHEVAGEPPAVDVDAGDAKPAPRAAHGRTREDLDARVARGVGGCPGRPGPEVRDRRDRDAALRELERRAVGAVRRRHHDRASPGAHAVAVQVASRRAGQHHAGAVVAREHERLLDRPGCEHDLACAHLPQALAGQARRGIREVVREPFDEPEVVVRKVAEGRGAGQHAHARVAGELGEAPREPGVGRLAVDARHAAVEQRAAGLRPLVGEDHARAARGGRERRGEARGPGADDEHVAVRKALGVAVRVRLRRRAPEARRAADQRLVERRPGRARPHEGLVVEARRKERRQEVACAPDVEAKARPAVLGMRLEPVVELDLRRARGRRLARGVAAHRHQRVRFLGACRDDAARPVVLERAPDEVHAVRKQRGGERVTGEALVVRAVEAEAERARAVDAPALRRSGSALTARAPRPCRCRRSGRSSCRAAH